MPKHIFGTLLAAYLVLLGFLPAAEAANLDQYRSQGIIAERYDGMVEIRSNNAPAEAQRIVSEVNAKRSAIYRKRAASQGVPVEEVGKVYASEIAQKAPAGTYIKKADGSYIRK
jgi:uncharacterized protein YdbL (DUF1318 family)